MHATLKLSEEDKIKNHKTGCKLDSEFAHLHKQVSDSL